MSKPSLDFKAVDDVATTEVARELIGEYLRWIAHLAKENYDLSFDVDAMVESDINDRSKFYPPDGRFYLVRYDGSYVGVGCLKRLAPGVAEIQRRLAPNGITMTFFGLRAINLGEYGRLVEEQKKAEEQLRKEKADTEIVVEQQRRQELVEESEARRKADRVTAEARAAAEAEKIRVVQTAESRLEVARREAELEKIRVAAAAEATKIKAEADAQAQERTTIAEAEGKLRLARVEAEAQEMLARIVNRELIEWRRIQAELKQAEKWDGKLPLLSGLKAFSFLDLAKVLKGSDRSDEKE